MLMTANGSPTPYARTLNQAQTSPIAPAVTPAEIEAAGKRIAGRVRVTRLCGSRQRPRSADRRDLEAGTVAMSALQTARAFNRVRAAEAIPQAD